MWSPPPADTHREGWREERKTRERKGKKKGKEQTTVVPTSDLRTGYVVDVGQLSLEAFVSLSTEHDDNHQNDE